MKRKAAGVRRLEKAETEGLNLAPTTDQTSAKILASIQVVPAWADRALNYLYKQRYKHTKRGNHAEVARIDQRILSTRGRAWKAAQRTVGG